MKSKFLAATCTVIAILMTCTVFLAGCFGNSTPEDTTPKEYTIQYTDDRGTHQITVTAGMPYSLDVVPTKNGYTFMGLYDAEVGGTQYVSASGASLSPFNDGKNMVLFPQFKAKDYTVILDYQGAAVTGDRQLTVAYGSSLPELPKNLAVEHSKFAGWYTQQNCEGTQIADEYGLIPVVSVLNDTNFDLSGEYVYLYAGFEAEKHTVTFCFESGMDTEEVQVPYNTSISEVVPTTRVNGNAVLTWSKTQGGEVWNGKVTDDMVLYAVEYAPVIDFDSNGGNEVTPLVARAGSTIALPTPTKDLAKFSHWEDMSGNKYTATTMPSSSTSLKAVWQAKLVFDENGGSDVDDISVTAGTKITLPTPEKDGFIFAGWYTADKEQYTSTTMPSSGVALKAGWYKEKTDTVVVINSTSSKTNSVNSWRQDKPTFDCLSCSFNYSDYSNGAQSITVKIDWHAQIKTDKSTSITVYADFYSQKTISTTYLMKTSTFNNVTSTYREFTFSTTFTINDDFYICWYENSSAWIYLSDFYYTVHYPDTANLYL